MNFHSILQGINIDDTVLTNEKLSLEVLQKENNHHKKCTYQQQIQ
jgi:hypothetical protein